MHTAMQFDAKHKEYQLMLFDYLNIMIFVAIKNGGEIKMRI